jgi:hypothetical protein
MVLKTAKFEIVSDPTVSPKPHGQEQQEVLERPLFDLRTDAFHKDRRFALDAGI